MLTQDVTKELEAVMEQLQQQGKEPTVALVKARMKTPVPMPASKVGRAPTAFLKSRWRFKRRKKKIALLRWRIRWRSWLLE